MFFKKKEKGVPDVGQEDTYDREMNRNGVELRDESGEPSMMPESSNPNFSSTPNIPSIASPNAPPPSPSMPAPEPPNLPPSNMPAPTLNMSASNMIALEFEKINAKIEAMVVWIKQFYERFYHACENIGEVRNMALTNEKSIAKAVRDSTRAIDLVKEVKPEKLRIDNRRLDMKINALSEKIELSKQFSESIMKELKVLKRRADVFIGTEELLKLNDEVKKDLIEIQKFGSRVRLDSDKSEQIFIELKKSLSEVQRIDAKFTNFSNISSELREEVEKLKIKARHLDDIRKSSDLTEDLIEKTLLLAKKNKQAIGGFTVTDYEKRLNAILKVVDNLVGQISDIKRKLAGSEDVDLAPKTVNVKKIIKDLPSIKKTRNPKPEKLKSRNPKKSKRYVKSEEPPELPVPPIPSPPPEENKERKKRNRKKQ